ncbi:MAG: flagellar hook-basal body protein [Planctomycetota bacterium]
MSKEALLIYGMYLSAAGALAEDARQSAISNNLANVNTPGFKADLAVFRERAAEAVEDGLWSYATLMDPLGGGVFTPSVHTRHTQGPLRITDDEFDFAIDGKGYFAVTDGVGTYYTRAGAFMRDAKGQLITPDGKYRLAESSGRPVTLPVSGKIVVAGDGAISIGGETVGKLSIFEFEDEGSLAKAGSNLYEARGATPVAGTGRIEQGALEMSGVSAARELTTMILAHRGYDANMQMIKMQDQTLADLVSIGRVSV